MTSTDRIPLSALIAAYAVPVFVVGGFAFLSVVPIAVAAVGTFRNPRVRWWTAALVAVYVVPVTLWLAGPSDAPSLSKYLSPVATALFASTAAVVAIAYHLARRRTGAKAA
ncbi:hypothetical protein [Actinokineospora globicatena]|uniref:Uncharacterized protein n=1 Tax=Actinokineospora globicatena TaxID=103729 RepID=A0A9W6QFZ4_9PSEU|nr:hypothetical protein [Actinokineospora globicatena]MCP2303230.1 hypothetical protein [Actinokineospora globicatena]GLW79646.1 hypothetical protein Aglo01_41270 [Actinokineospora globicatena]GLW85944.1 hypothetical protein Aglo02_35840 [Actinokineospora globicatena]GLW90256.1 hypothetical protein Aglo03_10720 [Actinokineospora globicatena]